MTLSTEIIELFGSDVVPEFSPYWEGLRAAKITFPRCRKCVKTHWYPMIRCPYCQSAEIEWVPISGHGRLYSWTVVRRAFSTDFIGKVPYTVGLIEFDEVPGIRLITNIMQAEPEILEIGALVEPVFSIKENSLPRVFFRLWKNCEMHT